MSLPLFTRSQVFALDQNSRKTDPSGDDVGDFHFIIENSVYKIPRRWAQLSHPGGEILLLDGRGSDISIPFVNNHREEVVGPILRRFKIGEIDLESEEERGKGEDERRRREMEKEFIAISRKVHSEERWFKASFGYYGFVVMR